MFTLNGGGLILSNMVNTTRPVVVGAAGGSLNTGSSLLSSGGTLSGTGALSKTGAGTWTMTGSGANYTGSLTVSQGVFVMNAALGAAQLTVSPDAVLRGNGQLSGALIVQGRLSPGDSVGAFTAYGPVTVASGSTLEFGIDGIATGAGAGNYSRLVAGSSVALYGGTLVPTLRGIGGGATNLFTPALGQTFRIITASGGISGNFSGLTQPQGLPSGLTFDTIFGTGTLDLAITPANYAQVGVLGIVSTPNRTRTGSALQALRPAAGTRASASSAALFNSLYPLDGAGISLALDQIGSAVYGQILEGSLQATRQVQMSAQRAGRGDERLWIDVSGMQVRAPGDGLVRGFDLRGGAGLVGLDVWRGSSGFAGVALGQVESQLVSSGLDRAKADAVSQHILGYAQITRGVWQLDLAGSLGRSRVELKRTVSVGAYGSTLESEPRLEQMAFSAHLSKEVRTHFLTVRPGVLVQTGSAWMGGFTEQGAAPAALQNHGGTVQRAEVGASLSTVRSVLLGRRALNLGLQVAYLGEMFKEGASSRVNLTGDPATVFTLRAQRPRTEFVQARASATLQIHPRSDVYFSAENSPLSVGQQGYNLNTGLRVRW
jgi:autotransporter-associated beta strand protein